MDGYKNSHLDKSTVTMDLTSPPSARYYRNSTADVFTNSDFSFYRGVDDSIQSIKHGKSKQRLPLQVFDQSKYAISKLQKTDAKVQPESSKIEIVAQIDHEKTMRGLRKSISSGNVNTRPMLRGRNPSVSNLIYKMEKLDTSFKESFPVDSSGRSLRFTGGKNYREQTYDNLNELTQSQHYLKQTSSTFLHVRHPSPKQDDKSPLYKKEQNLLINKAKRTIQHMKTRTSVEANTTQNWHKNRSFSVADKVKAPPRTAGTQNTRLMPSKSLSVEQTVETSVVLNLIEQFNKDSTDRDQFCNQAATLLTKIGEPGSKPKFYQTVIASAILKKLVHTILPHFSKVLGPVCQFLFHAIYQNYQPPVATRTNEDLSASDFINLTTYYQTQYTMAKEQRAASRKAQLYDELLKKYKRAMNSSETLVQKMRSFIQYGTKKKCFQSIQTEGKQNMAGESEVQRQYVRMRLIKMKNRQQMQFILSEWKLYVANLKMIKYQQALDKFEENEAKNKETLAIEVQNLQKSESDASALTLELQQKHKANKILSQKNTNLNDYLINQIPKMFRESLTAYFKFFNHSPFIKRIKTYMNIQFMQLQTMQQSLNLQLNYIHTRKSQEYYLPTSTHTPATLERTQPKNKKHKWYMQYLLRQHERIDYGGEGCSVLKSCSLEEILFRWGFLMVEQCLNKLRAVIEILEDQLIAKKVISKEARSQYLLDIDSFRMEESYDSQNSGGKESKVLPPIYKMNNILVKTDFTQNVAVSTYLSSLGETAELGINTARHLLVNLKHFYSELRTPLIEWRKQKLIRSCINLNLPYLLMAITFAIDDKYKLVNLDTFQRSVWKELGTQETNKKSPELLQRIFKEQLATKIPNSELGKLYQIPDTSMIEEFMGLAETNFTPQYNPFKRNTDLLPLKKNPKKLKQSTSLALIGKTFKNNKVKKASEINLKQRVAQKIQQEDGQSFEKQRADVTLGQFAFIRGKIEKMSNSQLDWFINEKELLNSQAKLEVDKGSIKAAQSSSLSSLLSFLFIFRSQLDHPFKYKAKNYLTPSLQTQEENDQKQDQLIGDELFDNIIHNILQVVHPVLLRTLHANIQDSALLFEMDSQKRDVKKLADTDSDELKLRWVNYILAQAFETVRKTEAQTQKIKLKKEAEIERQQAQAQLEKDSPEKNNEKDNMKTTLYRPIRQIRESKSRKDKSADQASEALLKKSLDKTLEFVPLTKIEHLKRNNYSYLIVLLATLSPESVWNFFKMDEFPVSHGLDIMMLLMCLLEPEQSACGQVVRQEIKNLRLANRQYQKTQAVFEDKLSRSDSMVASMSQIDETIFTEMNVFLASRLDDGNLQKGIQFDFRCLFIVDSVVRITGKNFLISFDQLVKEKVSTTILRDLITELFLLRPRLNTHQDCSTSQFHQSRQTCEKFIHEQDEFFSNSFDLQKVEQLPKHIAEMNKKHGEVMRSFTYMYDLEQCFKKIVAKFREEQSESSSNLQQMAQKHGLTRPNSFYCQLEKSISFIDTELIEQLMKFNSHTHALLWCTKIQTVISTFANPIKRFVNFLADDNCMISYSALWLIFKQINICGLNPVNDRNFQIKRDKIEMLLVRVSKLLQKRKDPFEIEKQKMVQDEIEVTNEDQEKVKRKSVIGRPDINENQPKRDRLEVTFLIERSSSQKQLKRTITEDNVSIGSQSFSRNMNEDVEHLQSGISSIWPIEEKTPSKIKLGHIPSSIDQQDIFIQRRLVYNLSMTVREAFAVLVVFLCDLQMTEILEFFFQAPCSPTGKPHSHSHFLLFQQQLQDKNIVSSPNLVKQQQQTQQQISLCRQLAERTTNQSLNNLKYGMTYDLGCEKDKKLVDQLEKNIIGTEEYSCPQFYIGVFLLKCMLTRGQESAETRQRQSLMMQGQMPKLIELYKPLLISLFEYYLFESYGADQSTQLKESCLPFSAIIQFYNDFLTESCRVSKSTLMESCRRIFNAELKEKVPSVSPKKSARKEGQTETTKVHRGQACFQDFLEIIFEISQEINVNRNESISQKFNGFMERQIMLGIRYRLSLEKIMKKESEAVENLYKKRLMNELEQVRTNSLQKIAINRGFAEESFADLI